MSPRNGFGQPVGEALAEWSPPLSLIQRVLEGQYCRLEPLSPDHAPALFDAFDRSDDSLWTYMAIGPFDRVEDLASSIEGMLDTAGWVPFAVLVDNHPQGFLSYLRMTPPEGTIEIGSIVYSPALQRTTAATEAIYLLIDHAFANGYRRVEWKCDDLNEPSRIAAVRLGFNYEGTFRNATHYKGRNRDTAWYAIVSQDWPDIRPRFEIWLDRSNFDNSGRQIKPLATTKVELPPDSWKLFVCWQRV